MGCAGLANYNTDKWQRILLRLLERAEQLINPFFDDWFSFLDSGIAGLKVYQILFTKRNPYTEFPSSKSIAKPQRTGSQVSK